MNGALFCVGAASAAKGARAILTEVAPAHRRASRVRYVVAALVALTSFAATAATRVVSLGGDVTETIYALHAQDTLAGVDSTSLWPEAATTLPNVGYVRQLSAEGVLALRPDLILATHDAGPASAMAQIRDAGVHVETLPVSRTPEDIEAKIRRIGALTAHAKEADTLANDVAARFAALAKIVAAMPSHPRAVFLMSAGQGSPMAAGSDTAADRAIVLAGGVNAVTGMQGYKPVSPEALVAMRPDAILLMKERQDAVGGVDGVLKLPGVADTPAGRARRIFFVEGQALLGFGPRTADAASALQSAWKTSAP